MTLRTVRAFLVALSVVVGGCGSATVPEADSEPIGVPSAALPAVVGGAPFCNFALVFGFDDAAFSAAGSHSFVVYVRVGVPQSGPLEQTTSFEVETISWLPAAFSGRVCVDALHLRCHKEPGQRYDLKTMLAFARGHRLVMWGPLEISEFLYQRAMSQVRFLDSGDALYIANDLGTGLHRRAFRRDPGGAINCIHAITDELSFERTGLNWGARASQLIAEQMLPFVVDRDPPDDDWILDRLNLKELPTERRPL